MIIDVLSLIFLLIIWIFIYPFNALFKNKKKYIFKLIPLLCHGAFIIYKIVQTKHAPFSNIYESLIFFSFIYFIKVIISNIKKDTVEIFLLTPGLIFIFISIFLSHFHSEPVLLHPTLRSIWMYIHVPAIFIGYVNVTFAFIISIIILFSKNDLSEKLNNELKSGYFFLTLGIITGAFWAEQSWGVYWSWDPKETWALVTWLFLICTFHIKKEKFKSIFVILTFLAMLFTYFGVTYILPGLHSYL